MTRLIERRGAAPARPADEVAGRPPAGPVDVVLASAVVALVAIGLIMVLSSSYTRGLGQFHDAYHFFKRQVLYALMGWAVVLAAQRLPLRRVQEMALPLVLLSWALLAVVLVVGQEIGGSRRWITLPLFNLQPSELAKLAVINFAAVWGATRADEMGRFVRGPLAPLAVAGVTFGLIMLEPDFGTASALLAVTLVVLFVAGMRWQHLVMLALAGAPLLFLLVWIEPYRMARLLAFIDPWADPAGRGWSVIQSLLAIGSGGLFGLGLGHSRQKFAYLPEHHTDFIYAILAEELGLVGSLAVVVLFAVVAWRGYRIALGLSDRYEQLLAVGLTSMVVVQALLNVGVVSGSLPVTGIPLPFISYGGSSLMASLLAVGVLLALSRRSVV